MAKSNNSTISNVIALVTCVAVVVVLGALPAHDFSQALQVAKKTSTHAPTKPAAIPKPAPVVAPPNPTSLTAPSVDCSQGSLLTVVAHEDDDILFTNPDLQEDIQAGFCVTTVYLTAGDDGLGQAYWQRRQAAAEAAYSEMYQQANDWLESPATVDGHDVTAARLATEPGVTLIFLRLPDGNLSGQGFMVTHHESLAALRFGRVDLIHSVDGTAAYSAPELTDSLATLMNVYNPTIIHTQNYNNEITDGDHSDHHATGYFTEQAYQSYAKTSILKVYAGYPVRSFVPNVSGQELLNKQATFLTYATHDAAACSSTSQCEQEAGYGGYLERQYSLVVASHVQPVAPPAVVAPIVALPKPKPKPAAPPAQICRTAIKTPKTCSLKQ